MKKYKLSFEVDEKAVKDILKSIEENNSNIEVVDKTKSFLEGGLKTAAVVGTGYVIFKTAPKLIRGVRGIKHFTNFVKGVKHETEHYTDEPTFVELHNKEDK